MNFLKGLIGLLLFSQPIVTPVQSFNIHIPEARYEETMLVSTSTIPEEVPEPPVIATTTIATTTPKKKVVDPVACSCIRTAREAGLNIPLVDAKDLKPNSIPSIGGGILLRYPDKKNPKKFIDHVAYILELRPDGIWVYEGNFIACKKSYRLILYSDPYITGFIK